MGKVYRNRAKTIIGSTEYIDVGNHRHIPAKIDTGADSSAIWASHIRIAKDGILHFCLFDQGSPYYTGEVIKRKDYKVAVVRSAFGHEQIRYRTHIGAIINGRRIRILFNLSNRSKNNYPVLIGRRTISGKFLVDVSEKRATVPHRNDKSLKFQRLLEKNPYEFHQKFIQKTNHNINNNKTNRKGE